MLTFARFLFLALLIATVTGCAGDWEAEIDSDTSWSGSFDGRTVDGRADDTIDLGKDDIICVVVQKQTRSGTLRVRLRRSWIMGPDDETDWKSTTAEFGLVTVCNED